MRFNKIFLFVGSNIIIFFILYVDFKMEIIKFVGVNVLVIEDILINMFIRYKEIRLYEFFLVGNNKSGLLVSRIFDRF